MKAARNAKIERLHLEERMSMPALAERFDISKQRIHVILRQRGVSSEETAAVRSIRSVFRWTCEACEKEGWRTTADPLTLPHARFCSRKCWGKRRSADKADLIAALLPPREE